MNIKILASRKKSRIQSFVSKKTLIGDRYCIGEKVYVCSNSIIDSYSLINSNVSIENAIIGKFCSIASGVNIGSFNHNQNKLSTHRFAYEKIYGFNVIEEDDDCVKIKVNIGSDVWIGINSIILPGVKVGRGAVVGAGSVVTKNIGEYEVWAGNPAKYIKKRFSEETIQYLGKFPWENFNEKKLQKIVDLNLDIEKIKNENI